MTDKKPRPGDDCPKCGTKLEVRQGMFHFRGLDFDGLVCGKCKALWTNPGKPSIFDAAAEAAAHPDGPAGFCCVCKKTTIYTCSECEIMETEAGHNVGPPRWLCGSEECVKAHEHTLRSLRLKGVR